MHEVSSINTIGILFVVFLGFLTLFLRRRFVCIPILIAVCGVTYGQVIVISGLNFTILRLLIFLCWCRLIVRKEIEDIGINIIDKTVILWLISGFVIYVLREQSVEALIYRLGFIYNGFGFYFFFRLCIQDINDLRRVIEALGILSIILSLVMTIEKLSGSNLFFIFGGVPEFSWIRDEKIRAQGPFAHAILAGTFGAVLLPIFIGLWIEDNKQNKIAIFAALASSLIVLCSSSSVPLFSFFVGIIALLLFKFRANMKIISRVFVVLAIALHLVMKAPVWYLLSRAGDIAGGTGWHRSYLIDQAIAFFEDWWLIGTSYTAHWLPYGLAARPNHTDITNQYIQEGVDGGILSMIFFISILVFLF